MSWLEQMKGKVDNYNALAERKELKSRLKFDEDSESLYLGSVGQFEYGVYQCELCRGDVCISVVTAMTMQLCFEHGE